MSITHRPAYLALDLETTHLDPNFGDIIEVAAVVVAADLAEIAHYTSPIAPTPDATWSDFAVTHHAASGLTAEADAARPLAVVLTDLDLWLQAALGDARPYLFGYSVHFDRAYLSLHAKMFGLPDILRHCSHRHYDVSTLIIEAEALGDMPSDHTPAPHRALADCRHALATARRLRQQRRLR